MKKFALFTLAATMFSAFSLKAQDEPKGKLTVSGYVDVQYSYNLNTPPFVANDPTQSQPYGFSVQNPGRIFDIKHNQFSLGLAQTKFAYTTDKSEVVVDLTFGPNAELGQFANIFGTMMNIKQAYLAYKVTDKLTFTAGQFGTHVGYELIDAPLNYNYSLSYLFGNGPFYHTGAKLSYMFSDNVGLMVGLVNGWDSQYDFNKTKSAIAQLYLKPTDGFNIYVNYIGGDEKNGASFPTIGNPYVRTGGSSTPYTVPDSIKTVSHLFDLTTTYQLTDALKFGINAAYGMSNNLKFSATEADGFAKAKWGGVALYADYRFSDVFGLGLRAEYFNDHDGVRYVTSAIAASSGGTVTGVIMNEYTLTSDIRLKDGHFTLKPEVRIDVCNPVYATGAATDFKGYNKFNSDGTINKSVNVQTTVGLAAIYAF